MNTSDIEENRQKPEGHRASFASRLIRFMMKLFILILLGISLGTAAYFGAPALYEQYIEPIQINSQRIAEIEDVLLQNQSDSRSRISEFGERLAEIEGQQAGQTEILSEIQVDIQSLQGELKQQSESFVELQIQTEIIDVLQEELQNTVEKVEYLTGKDAPTQKLEFQLQLIRVMELITRTRLWLTQNNFGLASQEVQAAKQALKDVADVTPEEDADNLQQIIDSLDVVLRYLPENPVIAADNLEITWNLLFTTTDR